MRDRNSQCKLGGNVFVCFCHVCDADGKVCEPCEQLYDTLDALSECSCSLLLGSRVADSIAG